MFKPCAVLTSLVVLSMFPSARVSAQESTMLFDAALVVADHRSRFESTLDFNNDGYADVLDWWWANSGSTAVWITGWINDGTGRLVKTWTITLSLPVASQPTSSATVGDFNNDGLDDFLLAFDDILYYYTSNGVAMPTLESEINVVSPWGVQSLVAADFNLDGLQDFAWADTWVTVMLNQGDNTFVAAEPAWNTTDVNEVNLVLGDVNSDGYPDILNVRQPALTIWYLVDGLVQSSEGFFGGIGLDHEITPAVGDIDGDLDVDVVMFNPINGQYAVIRNGPAGLAVEGPRTGGPATSFFDIDDDGDLDGVCCGGGCCVSNYNTKSSKFEIAINDGTGLFAPSWSIENVGSHHLAGIVDLDHDGDWDLVAGRTVYYSEGPITGPVQHDLATFGIDNVYLGIQQGYVSDFDNDGDPDLRFGLWDVACGFGDGAWQMRETVFPDLGNPLLWFGPGWPGDWDGDGDIDLIETKHNNFGGVSGFRENHVLWNNGSGVLSDGGICADPSKNMSPAGFMWAWDDPNCYLPADIDGDGDLDVVIFATALTGSSRLWLNDGAGFFTYAGDMTGRVQWIGHLNGGTIPDLVTYEWYPPDQEFVLLVRYGLGGGAFSPGTFLDFAFDGQSTLAVIDIDDDGNLDIVANRDGTTYIVALFNDGMGGWAADDLYFLPARVNSGAAQRAMTMDVNEDGVDDLIVANSWYAANSSWIFIKKVGAPGFKAPVQQNFSASAHFDRDGDGDEDLIVGLASAGISASIGNRNWSTLDDGLRQQYGLATSGSGGTSPVLGATGPFRLGESAALRMNGMPGSALGLLSLSLAPSESPNTPLLGTTGYNWPWLSFFFLTAPAGQPGVVNSSSFVLPYLVTQDLVDIGPIYHQVYWQDAGHPNGVASSEGLLIDYR
jgi:hypothetical protein